MKQVIFICLAALSAFQAFTQAKLQVASGTTITSSNDAQIVLDDTDLDNDGNIEQNTGDGGFTFTGVHEGWITGKGVNRFDKLTVAKSGSTTLLLKSDLSISSKLLFTEGRLNIADNNVYLGTNGVLEGETEANHLFSNGRGYVESIQQENNGLTMHPGNLGAIISSGSNLGKTIVRRGHLAQLNTLNGNQSILRYYDIIPANNLNVNATVRFQYFDNEANDIDEAEFSVLRSSTGVGWTDLGADAKNASSNFVEKKGVTQLSRFTLSTASPAGKAAYNVWPNPVIQDANINLSSSVSGNIKISIYDSRGELVQVQQARIGVGINQVKVDMRKLPQGNYTIQTNWGGQTKTSRLNKM